MRRLNQRQLRDFIRTEKTDDYTNNFYLLLVQLLEFSWDTVSVKVDALISCNEDDLANSDVTASNPIIPQKTLHSIPKQQVTIKIGSS